MDFLPCPVLPYSPLSKALDARNIGWPDSVFYCGIIISAVLSQFPFGLSEQVLYHFFSDPSPKNDQRPQGNLRAYFETFIEFWMQSSVFPFSPYNVIKHWHEDDSTIEVLRFTLFSFHKILNLFEDAQRRESWLDFPLELRLHAIDAVQFLEVVVLRIPFDFTHPSRVWVTWLSRRRHRLWQ